LSAVEFGRGTGRTYSCSDFTSLVLVLRDILGVELAREKASQESEFRGRAKDENSLLLVSSFDSHRSFASVVVFVLSSPLPQVVEDRTC